MRHSLYVALYSLTITSATFFFPATPGLVIHAQDQLALNYQTEFKQVNITLSYLSTSLGAAVYDSANLGINPVPGVDQNVLWYAFFEAFDQSRVVYPVDCYFRLTEYGNNDNNEDSVHFSVKERTAQPYTTWSLQNQLPTSSSKPNSTQSATSGSDASKPSSTSNLSMGQSMGLMGGAFGICFIIILILLWRQIQVAKKRGGTKQPTASSTEEGSEMFLQGHTGLRYPGQGGNWVHGRPVYESDGKAVASIGDGSRHRGWSDGKTSYVVAHELVSEAVVPELTGEVRKEELPSRLSKTPILVKEMVSKEAFALGREPGSKSIRAAPGWV